ncbi:MAG: NAD(P)-dependent alcohol dehydrogenase [Candidatus Melainabacteria bacterium]|nr:NAD(P)-dependent alcohol dehydrogenase [Candidatus Melainabacteria bacterium]
MSTATKADAKVKSYEINGDFGIDALKVSERPSTALGPNQVRLKMHAASLNYRDLMVIKGDYTRKLPFPLIPLSDGAGEVIETGSEVTRVKVGDRVAGTFFQKWLSGPNGPEYGKSALGGAINGMLADQVVLHEDGMVHIPEYMTYEDASTLPCAAVTAWNALIASGGIKPGDTVLTMGTGGVSLFALEFARMNGARTIITSSSDEKLERAKALGAHEVINYKTNPEWEKKVLELTNKAGVDHVVELGGAGTLERSMKSVIVGGQISLIGVLSGGGEINPMPILMKNIRLQGIYVGSREMFEHMLKAMTLHKSKPIIDRVFNFDQVKDALKHMESGAHFGKIVIKIS